MSARIISILLSFFCCIIVVNAQSGRQRPYSEVRTYQTVAEKRSASNETEQDDDVIRVDTDLVMLSVRVTNKKGIPVPDIDKTEFMVIENGIEQQIDDFYDEDQPFTVALLLDMSYSAVFKLSDIQAAAHLFIKQLKADDKVMIVTFDKEVHILCEATNNQMALKLAIDGAKIGSGTSLYSSMAVTLRDRFENIPGRKAIVLLTDGVDTTSVDTKVDDIKSLLGGSSTIIYPLQYDTFDDVRKNRRNDAQIFYDDDDRRYILEKPPEKGERKEDYAEARDFLKYLAENTGGRLYRVSSNTNLNAAFKNIADGLRKIYSLGYYPSVGRRTGERNEIKLRVARPDLNVMIRP